MPTLMYDSVNPLAIPANVPAVLGYVDGAYAWSQEEWDRFPNARKVGCSAVGARLAQVFDVEPGCIWPPANVVPLVQAARRAGFERVTVYCNEMNGWGPTRAAFDAARVPQPYYLVANYNGIPAIPAGSVGRQFMAPEGTGKAKAPGHYDVSIVDDAWLYGEDEDVAITDEDAAKIAAKVWGYVLTSGVQIPGYSTTFDLNAGKAVAETFLGAYRGGGDAGERPAFRAANEARAEAEAAKEAAQEAVNSGGLTLTPEQFDALVERTAVRAKELISDDLRD